MHELYYTLGGFIAGGVVVWLYRGALTSEFGRIHEKLDRLLSYRK